MVQSPPTILSVLRVRDFLFLWLSQVLSQIAFNILNFALVLRVYQLSGKATAVSALVLAFMVPQLILSLFAGAVVDRFDKKIVMLLANLFRAIVIIPLILFGGSIPMFYISAFVLAVATQFFIPAEAPMIPKIVKKELLLPANSLFTGTMYGSIILGYILAGPSLKFLGSQVTFIILALFFAFAAFFNWLLPGKHGTHYLRKQVTRLSALSYNLIMKLLFDDIGQAIFILIKLKKVLFAVLLLTMSQTVIIILGVLFPGFAEKILSVQIEDSSLLLLAPAAMGMVVGSIFVAHVGHRIHKSKLIIIGVFLSGILLMLLPAFSRFNTAVTFIRLTQILPIDVLSFVVVVCFLLGFFNAMIIIPANIVIQEKSHENVRGRIYGLFNGLSALAAIIPVVLAGYFSDIFGVGKVMTLLGASIIIFGFLPLLRRKAWSL